MTKRTQGFTLIELLVVIAIIGIIAAFAIPSYQQQVLKAGRSEGHAALNQLAAIQERHYANNNRYGSAAEINLTTVFPSSQTEKGKYSIALELDAPGFIITATAIGSQAKDTLCPTLTINNIGEKGPNIDCWK